MKSIAINRISSGERTISRETNTKANHVVGKSNDVSMLKSAKIRRKKKKRLYISSIDFHTHHDATNVNACE